MEGIHVNAANRPLIIALLREALARAAKGAR
jgi:hypothetical protein